jgi:hypothetical protein
MSSTLIPLFCPDAGTTRITNSSGFASELATFTSIRWFQPRLQRDFLRQIPMVSTSTGLFEGAFHLLSYLSAYGLPPRRRPSGRRPPNFTKCPRAQFEWLRLAFGVTIATLRTPRTM